MKKIHEAQESVWINKTLAKVCLDSDTIFGCVYSMICDVKQALGKDPSLSEGWYKVFFNKPEFLCSHQMIQSLPFKFVEQLKVGVETNLPCDYIKAVQNDALRAETNHIQSIQLWKSIAMYLTPKNTLSLHDALPIFYTIECFVYDSFLHIVHHFAQL